MGYSIFFTLLIIALFCYLYTNFAEAEAVLDHFKLNKNSTAPPNFMHKTYLIRNGIIAVITIFCLFHCWNGQLNWYYYLSLFLACLLFYIPLHDGWYYVTRNRWKPGSYRGFWMGVDSNPANKFMKIMNEPTMRMLLFGLGVFVVIFVLTYEPFK